MPRSATAAPGRDITSFDADWRFLQQDLGNGQEVAVDDANWRKLDVPHDWSIEGPVAQSNPSGQAGGYFPDGVSWYRKHFTLGDEDAQKRVFIDFDGVMANSDVWINGFHLGNRPYGYVSFEYELTGHLNFGAGAANVLAVRSDTSKQPASRYYFGSGITRHVRLVVTDPLHFDYHGLFISTPQATPDAATIHVQGTILNQGDAAHQITPRIALFGPDGSAVPITPGPMTPVSVDPGKSVDFSQDVQIDHPQFWDLDQARLYKAVVSLADGDQALDDQTASFGIRTFKFEPATGFWLNGKNIRIQGVCLHAEASAFGVAVPAGAWERRLAALKEWGVNAVRLAHNPPDPALLDVCDRMGVIVMDEMFDCWDVAKNPFDYHLYFDKWSVIDTRSTVRRDRNHPSIFLYSAGNEIHDTPNGPKSVAILTGLVKEFHENDPTRPVTQALFRPNSSHDYDDGLADLLDVVGTNYRMSELLAAQQAKPTRTLIGTENHLSDIPIMSKNPPLSGIFIWVGVDYLGESHLQPGLHGESGLLDRTDQPKPFMYEAASTWRSQPFVHMVRAAATGRAPTATIDGETPTNMAQAAKAAFRGPPADWSPANQAAHTESVAVYSNCPSVELILNGASVGKSSRRGNTGTFTFNVPFAPGTLSATGYDKDGQAVATEEYHTAGPAAKIVLTPDQTKLADDWNDVSFVRATVTDAKGVPVLAADNEITFTVTGAGKLAATDSADGNSQEPFQGNKRQAFGGTCLAFVKATAAGGPITITATADGLADGSANLEAVPANAP
ncbi:MAG: glycoside hydrolase family 2 TIM barrel-domain containing protein [Tepidisphaeraceae bacterium]